VIGSGPEQTFDLPIADHPYFTAMPIWGLPGLLSGSEPRSTFEQESAHLYYYIPPNIKQTLNLRDGQLAEIKPPDIRIDSHKFARAIAKIAYCQAVAVFGCAGSGG